MSLCNECRNLIDTIDSVLVSCEAHMFAVECKDECKLFLSSKCRDKRKMEKNNKAVEDVRLKEYEDAMFE